jgi:hypothetical protein
MLGRWWNRGGLNGTTLGDRLRTRSSGAHATSPGCRLADQQGRQEQQQRQPQTEQPEQRRQVGRPPGGAPETPFTVAAPQAPQPQAQIGTDGPQVIAKVAPGAAVESWQVGASSNILI